MARIGIVLQVVTLALVAFLLLSVISLQSRLDIVEYLATSTCENAHNAFAFVKYGRADLGMYSDNDVSSCNLAFR